MPRFHKYKLLLDEGFPVRSYFPRLNSVHNLKHIVKDLKKSGIKDPEIFSIAKKLATIVTDAPVAFKEEECSMNKFDEQKALEAFEEIGFKSLAKRLKGENEEPKIKKNLTSKNQDSKKEHQQLGLL